MGGGPEGLIYAEWVVTPLSTEGNRGTNKSGIESEFGLGPAEMVLTTDTGSNTARRLQRGPGRGRVDLVT